MNSVSKSDGSLSYARTDQESEHPLNVDGSFILSSADLCNVPTTKNLTYRTVIDRTAASQQASHSELNPYYLNADMNQIGCYFSKQPALQDNQAYIVCPVIVNSIMQYSEEQIKNCNMHPRYQRFKETILAVHRCMSTTTPPVQHNAQTPTPTGS